MRDARPMVEDLAALHWHVDPCSKRYRTATTATRAAAWLNAHEGPHDHWLYRVGPMGEDGRVRLERRFVGGDVCWWDLLPASAEAP